MSDDEIRLIASPTLTKWYNSGDEQPGVFAQTYIEFARAIAAAEREACQKICEEHAADQSPPYKAYEDTYMDGWLDASNECSWAIRARNHDA